MMMESGECPFGECPASLGRTSSAVSLALAHMQAAGLVACPKQGSHRLYSLTPRGRVQAEIARGLGG